MAKLFPFSGQISNFAVVTSQKSECPKTKLFLLFPYLNLDGNSRNSFPYLYAHVRVKNKRWPYNRKTVPTVPTVPVAPGYWGQRCR